VFKHRKEKEFKGFDYESALAEIIGHPGFITPLCHCPLPCTLGELSLVDVPPEDFDYNDEFDSEDDRWTHEAEKVTLEKEWKEWRVRELDSGW
jgi:hypothetical protein